MREKPNVTTKKGFYPALAEGSIDPIPQTEEKGLFDRIAQGDRDAWETVIKSHLRFVVMIAKEYENATPLELSEIIAEGRMGLLKAIEKFDPDRGVKFISFAVWWIRQAIRAMVPQSTTAVRLPGNVIQNQIVFERLQTQFENEHGYVDKTKIFEQMGITRDAARSLFHSLYHAQSIDEPVVEGNGKLYANPETFGAMYVSDDPEHEPDAVLERETLHRDIFQAVRALPPKERFIIRLHYGFASGHPVTMKAIGDRLGLSRERIRQLKERALDRLRDMEPVQIHQEEVAN